MILMEDRYSGVHCQNGSALESTVTLRMFSLPFEATSVTMITGFIAAAVGKIYKLRAERLCELKAPWLSH